MAEVSKTPFRFPHHFLMGEDQPRRVTNTYLRCTHNVELVS